MARFNMVSSSSLSRCGVMVAMVIACLSLSPVAIAQNKSSVLNSITDKNIMSDIIFVKYSFVYDSYRVVEPMGTVLKPGQEKPVNVDDYPGVKQVECDITRYSNTYNFLYNMKAIVWFFKGPSQTKFKFENNDMHFSIGPNFDDMSKPTGMQWGFDNQVFWTPKFLKSHSMPVLSENQASI